MTPDERLEALLNRAGQTISDLPMPSEWGFAHEVNDLKIQDQVENLIRKFVGLEDDEATGIRAYTDFILHLTDVIDRMETALENQVTLHEKLMHVIGNADIPDGVSYDQFCLVVDSIYTAVQTAQEGWENYEEGVPKDGSVDDE